MPPAASRPPLVRGSDRMVAGVCAGLARHLGWPVRMVRIGMAIAALAGGAGVAFYAWLWIMVPTADESAKRNARQPASPIAPAVSAPYRASFAAPYGLPTEATAPGLAAPVSVREDPGHLDLVPAADLWPAAVQAVRAALVEPGSVGVIVVDDQVGRAGQALTDAGLAHLTLGADHEDGEHRLQLVPATVAKGLEYDRVVVLEPAAIAAAEPDHRTGLRRLYVVLTRAVTGLTVVHTGPLPVELVPSAGGPPAR